MALIGDLRSRDGTLLADTARSGTVYSVSWTQWNYNYSRWEFDVWDRYNSHQTGQAIYDGTDVWLDTSRGTHPGYHDCFADRRPIIDVTATCAASTG